MNRTILIVISLLLVSPAFATNRLVPSVYPTIQAGINAAGTGDTVIVADGVHTGMGNRNIDFNGKAITVKSQNGPENCIIDCQALGCGFLFHSGEDESSVLDGFTISNGYSDWGGGIGCHSSPTITNCTLTGNTSSIRGGAIYFHDGSPKLTNCTITGNNGGFEGGGLYCFRYSSPTITNCTLTGNTASSFGGAIYFQDGSPKLTNCTIAGNSTEYAGGGIYCHESSPTIANCVISGNTSSNLGGGMYNYDSSPTITNCTFSSNAADEAGGGVFCDASSNPALTNCILWLNEDSGGVVELAQLYGGEPDVIYSCIQDDAPNDGYIPFGGESNGNIDDDPMFVRDPNDGGDGWGVGFNDDFGDLHLQIGSPCINAGKPDFVAGNQTDIDGQPRVMGLRVDMGADEFFIPMIIVTRPQGGEVWVSGSIHEIEWLSYGVSNMGILYSKDGGSNWQTIEAGLADTGGYTWYLPDIVDSNKCLISVVPSVPDTNVLCIGSGLFTIGPDFPDPAVASRWKSLGGGFKRSGLSENYGPELGCVKWQFETDGPVSTSVTIGVDDRVYIPCEDGQLYSLDADGVLLWSYDTNSPLISSPTIGQDGTVYVGSMDDKLYAIDIDGNLRWTHSTDGFIYSSPAVSEDGKVYVCSQDGVLYALGQDGSELWSFETDGFGVIGGSIFGSPAIGADGTVYVAGLYDPNLYALDPNDGGVKWACNLTDPCDPDSRIGWPFASPVVATDGTIYQTLLYDANLYAIEPNDGNIIWSLDLADPCSGWFDSDYANRYGCAGGWSEPALGPDGTIYVSYDDPYLRAVDPNGTIKWVTQLGMMGGFTLAVGSDGLIYAASDDAYLCVVNPDGEEVARFEGYDWLSFPVIAADNTIIVNDANNTVWAIGGDDCEEQIPVLHRPQDLNTDWGVNFKDFALLAADWLECTDTEIYPQETEPRCDYAGDEIYLIGDVDRNLYVDLDDIAALANRWLNGE